METKEDTEITRSHFASKKKSSVRQQDFARYRRGRERPKTDKVT